MSVRQAFTLALKCASTWMGATIVPVTMDSLYEKTERLVKKVSCILMEESKFWGKICSSF